MTTKDSLKLTLICTILLVEIDLAKTCETALIENWLIFNNEFINNGKKRIRFGIVILFSATPSTLNFCRLRGAWGISKFTFLSFLPLSFCSFYVKLNWTFGRIHRYRNDLNIRSQLVSKDLIFNPQEVLEIKSIKETRNIIRCINVTWLLNSFEISQGLTCNKILKRQSFVTFLRGLHWVSKTWMHCMNSVSSSSAFAEISWLTERKKLSSCSSLLYNLNSSFRSFSAVIRFWHSLKTFLI